MLAPFAKSLSFQSCTTAGMFAGTTGSLILRWSTCDDVRAPSWIEIKLNKNNSSSYQPRLTINNSQEPTNHKQHPQRATGKKNMSNVPRLVHCALPGATITECVMPCARTWACAACPVAAVVSFRNLNRFMTTSYHFNQF